MPPDSLANTDGDNQTKRAQKWLDHNQYSRNGILRYEEIFGRTYVSVGGEATTKRFVSQLDLEPGQKVLDVGCGTGGGAFYMARKYGVEVYGVDLSNNMIGIAEEYRNEMEPSVKHRVQFYVDDATTMEYPENFYDVVYSRDTILHIDDKLSLYKKLLSCLKPGGKLMVTDYNHGDKVHSERFRKYVAGRGYQLLTVTQYGDIIKKAGFTNVVPSDKSAYMMEIMKDELVKFGPIKEKFIIQFSEEDYDYIYNGWMDKMDRVRDGDQVWGFYTATKSFVKTGVLLGMGNPLLDISATVKKELLSKHSLKANDAILTEDEAIFEDMKAYELDFIAGGATQNSIRVAQWIIAKKYATAYFGCVGRDDTSKTLEEKAREAGVNVQYQFSEHPTGRCAVLITGQDRSLVTKLDAANHYNVSHLEEEANWSAVKAAEVVYSAGFFLTVSVDSMLKVSKHCAANNKTYCLNLSAPFLIQFFKDQMMSVLPFADIVFGNETEAATYAEVHCPELKDVGEIAKKIAMLPKENGSKSRLVIITQGSDPVIVVEHGKVLEFPVETLANDKIVDTNGAGDAFVGGFLAQYVQDKPLETAVRCGIWAATHIIQRSGCTYAPSCDFA